MKGKYSLILALLKEIKLSICRKLILNFLAVCLFFDFTSEVKNSDSYVKRNKSASRGAQLVPMGIPITCLNVLSSNLTNIWSIRKSSNFVFHLHGFSNRFGYMYMYSNGPQSIICTSSYLMHFSPY